jgi:nicotinamidase-related amidase
MDLDLRHVPSPIRTATLKLQAGGRAGSTVAESRVAKLDANKCALVLVDLQHFFLKADGAPGQALVPAVNAATAAARACGMPVFWVNWGVRSDRLGYPGGARSGAQGIFPPAAGEPDAEIWHELDVDHDIDIFVSKHRLTGFFESELDAILRQAAIRTLFFGGVNTGQCVWGTVIDAKYLGYDSIIVTDMCATTEPECATAFVEYNNASLLTTSANIVAAFEPLAGTTGICPAQWAKL